MADMSWVLPVSWVVALVNCVPTRKRAIASRSAVSGCADGARVRAAKPKRAQVAGRDFLRSFSLRSSGWVAAVMAKGAAPPPPTRSCLHRLQGPTRQIRRGPEDRCRKRRRQSPASCQAHPDRGQHRSRHDHYLDIPCPSNTESGSKRPSAEPKPSVAWPRLRTSVTGPSQSSGFLHAACSTQGRFDLRISLSRPAVTAAFV